MSFNEALVGDGDLDLTSTPAAKALYDDFESPADGRHPLDVMVPLIEASAQRALEDSAAELQPNVVSMCRMLHDENKPKSDSEGAVCEDVKFARDIARQVFGRPPASQVKAMTKVENDDLRWWVADPTMPFHTVDVDEQAGRRFKLTTMDFSLPPQGLRQVVAAQRRLLIKIVQLIAALPADAKAWLLKESVRAQSKKDRAAEKRQRLAAEKRGEGAY